MKRTTMNGPNSVGKDVVLPSKTSREENGYPKLFKVVHKDLFNVIGDKKKRENIPLKENGANNWEFFLNFKFKSLEVTDKEHSTTSTVTKCENGSEGLFCVDSTSTIKASDKIPSQLEITNDVENKKENENTFQTEKQRNRSVSFPQLCPKLHHFQDYSRSSKSFPPSLSSLQNLTDRLDGLEENQPNSLLPSSTNQTHLSGLQFQDVQDTSLCEVHGVHIIQEDKSITLQCIVRIAAVLFVSLSVTLLCVLGSIPEQYPDNIDKLARESRATSRLEEVPKGKEISYVSTKFKAPAPNIENRLVENEISSVK